MSKALYNRKLIPYDDVHPGFCIDGSAMLAAVNLCAMMSCQVLALLEAPHNLKSMLSIMTYPMS
jgi:hypothetical protein